MTSPPVSFSGLLSGRTTCCPSVSLRLVRVLADGLAGDGLGVFVQDPGLFQPLQDDRDPAGGVQIRRDVLTARLQVAQQRRALADPVEVVDVQLDPHLLGHGEEMQDAVGRAAAARDRGDRVLERLAGDDVAGRLAAPEHVHHEPAGFLGDLDLVRVFGRDPRGKRGDPEHLERHRHRVRGELAAAGAGAGRRGLLDRGQLVVGDPAGGVGADRLEHLLDRDPLHRCTAPGRSSRRTASGSGRSAGTAPSRCRGSSCRRR